MWISLFWGPGEGLMGDKGSFKLNVSTLFYTRGIHSKTTVLCSDTLLKWHNYGCGIRVMITLIIYLFKFLGIPLNLTDVHCCQGTNWSVFYYFNKVIYFWEKKTDIDCCQFFFFFSFNFIQTHKRVCLIFLSSLYFDDNFIILEKLMITPLLCVKHEMSIMH